MIVFLSSNQSITRLSRRLCRWWFLYFSVAKFNRLPFPLLLLVSGNALFQHTEVPVVFVMPVIVVAVIISSFGWENLGSGRCNSRTCVECSSLFCPDTFASDDLVYFGEFQWFANKFFLVGCNGCCSTVGKHVSRLVLVIWFHSFSSSLSNGQLAIKFTISESSFDPPTLPFVFPLLQKSIKTKVDFIFSLFPILCNEIPQVPCSHVYACVCIRRSATEYCTAEITRTDLSTTLPSAWLFTFFCERKSFICSSPTVWPATACFFVLDPIDCRFSY